MATQPVQFDVSKVCDTSAADECIPCQELLRRIDEDLAQWDLECAARRKTIGRLIAGIVVIAVVASLLVVWALRST